MDEGGIDTVDCAALSTGVSLNLVDGKLWDIGLTRDGSQATNNMGTSIGTLLESALGTAYDDVLIGNALNNQFTPGKGNDWVEGADGLDTVYLAESKSSYVLKSQKDVLELWSASANTGFKTLTGIERVVFTDSAIAWDLDGRAGQVAQILGAVFGAESVQNTKYAGIGLSLMDKGFSYSQLMSLAIEANLGIGASHAQVINLLYQNLLHVPADANAIVYWSAQLDQGAFTHASLAVMAADLDLNKQNINLIGLASSGLEYTPV